uniref:Uncharacterized protein n=1 Tax=Hucho hucho TaxID=62062 RepID=A0A4W5KUJ5_9TELE
MVCHSTSIYCCFLLSPQQDYVLKQVASKYHKMGWPLALTEGSIMQASYQTEELQREVIMLACSFGNKHCHRQAVSLISDWISSNKNRYSRLHPKWYPVVLA